MRRSLAKFSESEVSNHTPSLADFTTTTPELKFSVHTRPEAARISRNCRRKWPWFPLIIDLATTVEYLEPVGGQRRLQNPTHVFPARPGCAHRALAFAMAADLGRGNEAVLYSGE